MIRAFIALPLPEGARSPLDAALTRLKALQLDARLASVDSTHLTLKFLGDIEERQVDEVSTALGKVAARHPEFDYRLAGFGAFPHAANPRIVWIGIDGGNSLIRLHADIENSVAELGFKPEKRAFQPHLTLARLKSRRNVAHLFATLEEPIDLGTFTASSVHLYRSILRPEGALYQKLSSCELGSSR